MDPDHGAYSQPITSVDELAFPGAWESDEELLYARGADIVLRVVAIIGIRVGGESADQVIKTGEEFVGRQVDIDERSYGGAQPTHGGGGADTVADHITDDEGNARSGEWDTSDQSPPTPTLALAGR